MMRLWMPRAKAAVKKGRKPRKTVTRGKRAKSALVEAPVEVVEAPKPPSGLERSTSQPMKAVGLEADPYRPEADLFDESPDMPDVHVPRPDADLDEAQKAEFVKLLKSKMTLEERADQLVSLAHMTSSKTAAIGLRAIQVINEITGVTKEEATEAPSMFNLPEGAEISIEVEEPEK